jgi:hypothetical protein
MLTVAATLRLAVGCTSMPSDQTITLAGQGYFFVGGQYMQTLDGQVMAGQMFTQYQVPQERTQRYPVVMWHGGGQTGTNFLGTPDGRPGWADYLAQTQHLHHQPPSNPSKVSIGIYDK